MNYPKLLLGICLTMPLIGQATTDWTDKLQPMQQGCTYIDPTEKLNKSQRASIVKKSVKKDKYTEFNSDNTTLWLKGATAFGLPISRIYFSPGDEGYSLSVYFKGVNEAQLLQLRPQFKLPSTEGYEQASIKNTKLGYDLLGGASLVFDVKDKSITCRGLGS